MPATRSFLGTLWSQFLRRNRTRLRRKLGMRRDTPWMRPYEEDVIRDVLATLQPTRCLEWGGGMSTVQFPALLPQGAHWTSIEHDDGWAAQLASLAQRPGVRVVHVAPDCSSFVGDGTAEEFAHYLAAAEADAPYDFILVDGRARSACLHKAMSLLAPNGVVVLHDANRDAYQSECSHYPRQLLFQDARHVSGWPSGGVWLGSVTRDPKSALACALHERVWAFYRGSGRLLA